jgi:hypothetical protein
MEICKHHGLPKISGHFCKKCEKDAQKNIKRFNDLLGKVFPKGILLDVDKDGNPKVYRTNEKPLPKQ